VSKGISAGHSSNSYRGLVQIGPKAVGARNYSQCDSMLIGDQAAANTYPYIRSQQSDADIEHEASTCRISEDQLFYLQSRGIGFEQAVSMMVSGFCRDVFHQLPMCSISCRWNSPPKPTSCWRSSSKARWADALLRTPFLPSCSFLFLSLASP
jgi:Fe-S cluster assembly scaffold protein SufB